MEREPPPQNEVEDPLIQSSQSSSSSSNSNSVGGNSNINTTPSKMGTDGGKPMSVDAAGHKKDSAFRLFLLFMMTAQNSSVVLVTRYTRAGVAPEDLYVINDLVMITEVGKLVLAAALEYNHTNGGLIQSIKENIFDRPLDFFRILIPSLLYLIQNSVLYVAISNLTAPMFQVTYQCKLLTTAIVSVVMLQRRYSMKQWICLSVLGLGVAIVVLGARESTTSGGDGDAGGDKDDANSQNLFVGLMSVTVACLCSAFAGVYFEKVLKHSTNDGGQARAPVSMWMRNVQMAFFSICIALINMYREYDDRGMMVGEGGEDVIKPFMHGFTGWTWVILALQAGGGLLVAAVIKYADNVLKGMATGVSVATGTFASTFLFGTTLSMQFGIGAGMILASVYMFSNDVPAVCGGGGSKKKDDVEMKAMLPK